MSAGAQYVIEMLGATLQERDQQLVAAQQRIRLLEQELTQERAKNQQTQEA